MGAKKQETSASLLSKHTVCYANISPSLSNTLALQVRFPLTQVARKITLIESSVSRHGEYLIRIDSEL